MQLSRRARAPGAKRRGFIQTGIEIARKETPLGLYKASTSSCSCVKYVILTCDQGLGAVLTGIVPKMAIRFTSYEWYKQLLAKDGKTGGRGNFIAGLAAGVTEAVLVVSHDPVLPKHLTSQGEVQCNDSLRDRRLSCH